MAKRNPLLKPIVKWVGGKRQLLDAINGAAPKRGVAFYVEPFVGGAAVLLDRQPAKARINDYNPELINVYKVVRDDPETLVEILTEHEAKDAKEYFYKVRSWDRTGVIDSLSDTERAARIIYLNKTCFNGLFRVNSAGQLNVPYGRYKHPNIVNAVGINALHRYFKDNDIEITCGDYADALVGLGEGVFVYLDPPYMPISAGSSFTGYTDDGFDYDEQKRLRDECIKLKRRGAKFLESNSDCQEIRDLYDGHGFHIETVKAKRSINSRSDRRGEINEVLIRSW